MDAGRHEMVYTLQVFKLFPGSGEEMLFSCMLLGAGHMRLRQTMAGGHEYYAQPGYLSLCFR
jgi:hypothetical protein